MIEKYRAEYKAICVDLVKEKKYTLQAAADKMNVPSSSISDWIQSDKKAPQSPDQIYNQQLEEDILELTKENLSLKKRYAFSLMENKTAKKALDYVDQ